MTKQSRRTRVSDATATSSSDGYRPSPLRHETDTGIQSNDKETSDEGEAETTVKRETKQARQSPNTIPVQSMAQQQQHQDQTMPSVSSASLVQSANISTVITLDNHPEDIPDDLDGFSELDALEEELQKAIEDKQSEDENMESTILDDSMLNSQQED
jgi:hypothetical protein